MKWKITLTSDASPEEVSKMYSCWRDLEVKEGDGFLVITLIAWDGPNTIRPSSDVFGRFFPRPSLGVQAVEAMEDS